MNEQDNERFSVLMRISDERKLTGKGFTFEGLRYDSTAFSDYRKQYPQTKQTKKKIIKVDPDDISYIHVYLEELSGYLKVPCTEASGYTKGLSLYEHKIIKKINRDIIRESKDSVGLAKARMAIYDRVKEEQEAFNLSKKNTKLSSVKKQAQLSDVSNTGKGTINVLGDNSEADKKVDKKVILEDWDDDLEAFE